MQIDSESAKQMRLSAHKNPATVQSQSIVFLRIVGGQARF